MRFAPNFQMGSRQKKTFLYPVLLYITAPASSPALKTIPLNPDVLK